MKKNKLAALGVAAALTLGSVSVATAAVTAPPTAPMGGGHQEGMEGDHGPAQGLAQLKTVLAALVTKGTITQAQSDAIVAALAASAPTPPAKMPQMADNSAARDALVLKTLGITAADLKAARVAGKTLAQIDPTKTAALTAALVALENTTIDAAVTAGKITAAQATTLKAGVAARVDAFVNQKAPVRGMGDDKSKGPKTVVPKVKASPTAKA